MIFIKNDLWLLLIKCTCFYYKYSGKLYLPEGRVFTQKLYLLKYHSSLWLHDSTDFWTIFELNLMHSGIQTEKNGWFLFVKLRIPSSHLKIGSLEPLLCWHSSELRLDSILFWNESCTSPKLSDFTFHFIRTWQFKPFLKSSFMSSC